MPDTCSRCRFFTPAKYTELTGMCRRCPPSPVFISGTVRFVWSQTRPDDWCGGFELRRPMT